MTFVSSLQPDVGRGFLHVSNVFLFNQMTSFKMAIKIQQYVAVLSRCTSGIRLQIIDNKLHKTHLLCVPGYMCTTCTRSKIFIGMTEQDNSYTDIYMMPCNILISTLLFIAKISPE